MADETILEQDLSEVDDPVQMLESYAGLIEQQQEQIAEQAEENQKQSEVIERLNAQIEALRDSLNQSTEETVLMKAEVVLGQRREQQLREQIEAMEGLGMRADSKEV